MTEKNQKITLKIIQEYLGVSQSTASRYLQDVKKEYGIKIVTYQHIKNYLHLL